MNLFTNKNWEPMLLHEIKESFDSKDYLFELKFDGARAIVFASPKKVIIQNRHHMDITDKYPELQNIKKLVTKNTIFDGEIVSFDEGLPSFHKLQERAHLKSKAKIDYQAKNNPVIFICFDILYCGESYIDKPLIDRKKYLDDIEENEYFSKVAYVKEEGKKLFREIKKIGLEGIVAKKLDSTYELNTRSKNWLKIKNWQREEFIIGGFVENQSKSVISLVLGEIKKENLFYVGKVTMARKNKLYEELKKMKINDNPFFDFEEESVIYVKPTKKCWIEFIERTKNNHLRQPIYQDGKDDKKKKNF